MSAGENVLSARRGALAAAARWRLPFSRQAWRGIAGNWMGAGAGSSLDFQDHRTYVPGDDPRHIHWQAFARTGALTMKLYRAEVAPLVDLVVDVSASMSLTAAKFARTDELVAFCVECADRAGAPIRLQAVAGRNVRAVAPEEVRAERWRSRLAATTTAIPTAAAATTAGTRAGSTEPAATTGVSGSNLPAGADGALRLQWRAGALKVLISDLLFPGDPAALLAPMASNSGVSVILAPALAEESDLGWRGNVDLTDCESGSIRRQRVDEPLAERYRAAYARHFALWREACRRRGIFFARVPCEAALSLALGGEAFSAGAVEAAK